MGSNHVYYDLSKVLFIILVWHYQFGIIKVKEVGYANVIEIAEIVCDYLLVIFSF
jgi:hypothetical protein